MVSQALLDRLGPPKKDGGDHGWTTWNAGTGHSNDVIIWKPGMRFAINKVTQERYFAGEQQKLMEFMASGLHAPPPKVKWGLVKFLSDPYVYALSRGMRPEEIAEHCAIHPDWPNHLAFPITEDGHLVAWQARACDDDVRPKYTSGRTQDGWMPAHSTCWGLDRIRPHEPVYLCEGIFDALYFPTGVAYLGSGLHETQVVKVLDRLPSEVWLGLDRDVGTDPRQYRKLFDQVNRLHRGIVKGVCWPMDPATQRPLRDFGQLLEKGLRFGLDTPLPQE